MFETFYGLRHSPFSRDIPTSELYQSHVLEETLGRLEYAAQRSLSASPAKGLFRITSLSELIEPLLFLIFEHYPVHS